MNKIDKKTANFSYWVYILGCLVVVGLPAYFVNFDSESTAFTFYSYAFQLLLFLSSASIAWFIGKRYSLNYFVVCCLAFLGIAVWQVLGIMELLLRETITADILKEILSAAMIIIFGWIMFGIVVFIMSYPIQIIFLKFFPSKELK